MIQLQLNDQIVSIDKGELVGYEVNGHEFIHQKGSPGWGSADTEMFPIIGPVNEAGYQVQVSRGTAIQDQHGLLRQFPYELMSSNNTTVTYKKIYKAGTPIKNAKFPEKSTKQWLIWPFSFEFEKNFVLREEGLTVSFVVSGEQDMPFMLGYHPAFKLQLENPIIKTSNGEITLQEVIDVGSRALEVKNCEEIILVDKKELVLKTEGFGHFMCWTEVSNMICIEPISFYPYAVEQHKLHEGFQYLKNQAHFKISMLPKR